MTACISMFKSVEKLDFKISFDNSDNLQQILKHFAQYSHKILNFRVVMFDDTYDITKPFFKLVKVLESSLNGLNLPIALSKNCKKLNLENLMNIKHKWCKNLIDNSDLSGIQTLEIENISFENLSDLGNIGAKLVNIKHLN